MGRVSANCAIVSLEVKRDISGRRDGIVKIPELNNEWSVGKIKGAVKTKVPLIARQPGDSEKTDKAWEIGIWSIDEGGQWMRICESCLLYTSPSPRDS